MSLVAYAASSDEDSSEEECHQSKVQIPKSNTNSKLVNQNPKIFGHISDDDEEYVELAVDELKKPFTLLLPKPKLEETTAIDQLNNELTPTFAKLPMPKTVCTIVEEDDEFLHKKAQHLSLEMPPAPIKKGPVKITIPSLKDFTDVDADLAKSAQNKSNAMHSKIKSGSGLLNLLPKAKSEQNFSKATIEFAKSTKEIPSVATVAPKLTTKPTFIPDTVKNRRPAYNTEGVDGIKRSVATASSKPKINLVNCSDSDSDDEQDFFSLQKSDVSLPEVSTNEINAMVAKRAAQIADASSKFLETSSIINEQETMEQYTEEEQRQAQKRYYEQQKLDSKTIEALEGSQAKKRKRGNKHSIQVMDISSEQVMPSRDEWMRTALASSTAYQATGVLVDEEPASGTRRKHQITYLAHKAKANEAELQAMWSANRQNRRATQSKYGF